MRDEAEKYTVAEILSTIRNMPDNTLIEKRNKAMISLCFLTACRISALKDVEIGNIKYKKEYDCYCFIQKNATKRGVLITSYFVGDLLDIIFNVVDWKEELEKLGFDKKDPLFPDFKTSFNENSEQIIEITKSFIKQQQTIRDIFKKSFLINNLPYNNPHTFRHTLTRFVMALENAIALVGHELNLGVLLSSYGRGSESENVNALKNIKFE